MFWIALELSSSKVGFITRLTISVEMLTALKKDGSFGIGNTAAHEVDKLCK